MRIVSLSFPDPLPLVSNTRLPFLSLLWTRVEDPSDVKNATRAWQLTASGHSENAVEQTRMQTVFLEGCTSNISISRTWYKCKFLAPTPDLLIQKHQGQAVPPDVLSRYPDRGKPGSGGRRPRFDHNHHRLAVGQWVGLKLLSTDFLYVTPWHWFR